jgi:hypothetical protein
VIYGFNPSHFVVAAEQLKNDFRATGSLLEEGWKRMCGAFVDLGDSPAFQAALSKGPDGPALLYTPPISGAFFLGQAVLPRSLPGCIRIAQAVKPVS